MKLSITGLFKRHVKEEKKAAEYRCRSGKRTGFHNSDRHMEETIIRWAGGLSCCNRRRNTGVSGTAKQFTADGGMGEREPDSGRQAYGDRLLL